MITKRFLPDTSWWLNIHRTLHLQRVLAIALLPLIILSPWILVHFVIHATIDVFTHDKEWM
jgi:hypothetical protein